MINQWRPKPGMSYEILTEGGKFHIYKYGVNPDTGEYNEDVVISLDDARQAAAYMSWLDAKGENTTNRWGFDDAEVEIRSVEKAANLLVGAWRKWYAIKYRGLGPSTLEVLYPMAVDLLEQVTLTEEEIRRGWYKDNSFEIDLLHELDFAASVGVNVALTILETYETASGQTVEVRCPAHGYNIRQWQWDEVPEDFFKAPKISWYPPDPPLPAAPELPSVVLEVVSVEGQMARVGIADMFGARVFATVEVDEPVEVGHAVVVRARKYSRSEKSLVDAVYDGFADQFGELSPLHEVEKLKYTYDAVKAAEAHEDYCFKWRKEWEAQQYGKKPTRAELDAAEKKVFGAKSKRFNDDENYYE